MKTTHSISRFISAFSMVEVLVAMAILSVFVFILMGILDQSSRAWNETEQKVDAFREARAAQHMLTRDLQSIVQPTTRSAIDPLKEIELPFIFLNRDERTTSIQEVTLDTVLPPLENGASLFFFTSQANDIQRNNTSGDIVLVGYYVAYAVDQTASSGSNTQSISRAFSLYRFALSPPDTQKLMQDLAARVEQGNGAHPGPLLEEGASLSISKPVILLFGGDDVVARNIIDFQVDLTDEAGGIVVDWPTNQFPAKATIRFTACNYATAKLFEAPDDWYVDTKFETVKASKFIDFSFSVPFPPSKPAFVPPSP